MTMPSNHLPPLDDDDPPPGPGVSDGEVAELTGEFDRELDGYMAEWKQSLREKVTENFDPDQPRDEHGRWGSGGNYVSSGGHLKELARVGVPASQVPPPPGTIPRLPNLSDKQRVVESRFADAYLKDPNGMADKYRRSLEDGKVGVAPNVYATDDVKMLNRDFNPSLLVPGDKMTPENSKAMAANNTALHATANAIAKRAFLTKLDDLADLPDGHPSKSVLVTNGGCAAGKGSTLSRSTDPDDPHYGMLPAHEQVGAVWDAAGEQNATENKWVYDECRKRGIDATFAYVWAEPKDTWHGEGRGVIRRAERKGRMVDARLFADSYAEGAKNMAAFVDSHHDAPGARFVFIDNRDKGAPKLLDSFPRETLRWDGEKIYKDAVRSLESLKGKLPKSLIKGGLNGTKIWGPPGTE